jgi:hypothetical protein
MNGISMQQGIAGFARTVLVSGGLGLAGLGLVAGTAQAAPPSGPYAWCPGDDPGGGPGGPFNSPGPPNWDWNICHTYYTVNWGQGNVSLTIWDGENPPPDNRGPVGPCSLLDTRGCGR